MLFDDDQSLDSGVAANFSYQSGAIAGDIYWEQLTLGSFQIGYQAFSEPILTPSTRLRANAILVSATTVTNQDLTNGNFTGVIGLSCEYPLIHINPSLNTHSSSPRCIYNTDKNSRNDQFESRRCYLSRQSLRFRSLCALQSLVLASTGTTGRCQNQITSHHRRDIRPTLSGTVFSQRAHGHPPITSGFYWICSLAYTSYWHHCYGMG